MGGGASSFVSFLRIPLSPAHPLPPSLQYSTRDGTRALPIVCQDSASARRLQPFLFLLFGAGVRGRGFVCFRKKSYVVSILEGETRAWREQNRLLG